MQSTLTTVLMLAAVVLSGFCLAIPVFLFWMIMYNSKHYHRYCPTCGAMWINKRREGGA